jgi:sugar transferase (PEP-CTERM/EpsH1 system associated)
MEPPRRIVVFASELMFSVRKGIVDIDNEMPGLEWLVVWQVRRKPVWRLLKNEWNNVRRNGWRWIPYQIGELASRVVSGVSEAAGGRGPGSEYELDALLARPNLRLLRVDDLHAESAVQEVLGFAPELGLSLAAPILRRTVFGLPTLGTINLHKGKLPQFRGMPPAFWELWTGQTEIGCSVHWIDDGLDTGDVIGETSIPRSTYATLRGLQLQLDEVGAALMCRAVRDILEGRATARKQLPHSGKAFRKPTLAQVAALDRKMAAPSVAGPLWLRHAASQLRAHGANLVVRGGGNRFRAPRITVLLYHRVSDEVRDNLTVGVAQFDRQMALLKRHCHVLTLDEALAATPVPRSNRPRVAITFDDGYLDNYATAAPILRRHGLPAAFFVTTGIIGTANRFAHDLRRGNPPIPVMSWEQLREMRRWGFSIGSHTAHHIDCAAEPEAAVRDELARSGADLKSELGIERPVFAYPYGGREHMNVARLALVKEAGYAACLSAYGGSNTGTVDRFNVLRQGISHEYSDAAFMREAAGWSAARADRRPLILHVIHHLVMGGMENGLVNLVNHLPATRYRHVIACVEDFSDFRLRISRPDVEVVALERSRIGARALRRALYRLCRRLRPAIVHSRNLSGLDALLPAWLAGVRCRVHSEHGWDVDDLDGERGRPALLRRLHAPLIDRYITVSKDLERYLIRRVGVKAPNIAQIYNGVDTERFAPPAHRLDEGLPPPLLGPQVVRFGTVGRIEMVKDQARLLEAVALLVLERPALRDVVRLMIVGDGPLLVSLRERAVALGVADLVWLPGASDRVPQLLRTLDVFVLPSLNEGTSNTLLEAMASGLPTIASAVGGNIELVDDGVTGALVPPADAVRLAACLARYVDDAAMRRRHGTAARARTVQRFSLASMLAAYEATYDTLLKAPEVRHA